MSEVEKLFEEFKGRLVEVECECDDEKRAKCVMYPEYCDGTRKEIIDLVQLIDEGLNNKLLADKDTRIEELEKENAGLKERNIKDCKNFNRAVEKIGEQLNQKQYQLTKAKDLIKELCSMVRELNKPNVQLTNVDYSLAEAEQFLKEE